MKTKQHKEQTKEEEKICFKCHNKIMPEARHIDLITLDNKKIVEKISMHIICWGEYNQERVNQRIKEMATLGLKTIKPMLESSNYNY